MLKKFIVAICVSFSSLFALNQGMLNISDLDVEISVAFDVGQIQEDYAVDTYFFGFTYLDSNSGDNGAGNTLTSGDILIINELPDRDNVRLGFGLRLVTTSLGGEQFLATPLGAVIDVGLEGDMPTFWKSSIYYAPGALSHKDARAYAEFRTGVHIEAIENVRVFLEARSIHTSYINASDVIFNETIYGGVVVGF